MATGEAEAVLAARGGRGGLGRGRVVDSQEGTEKVIAAELIRFKFPSLASSEKISMDNITQGMQHVNRVPDAPEENSFGSCMAFPNAIYTPQLYITWDSNFYVRGSIASAIKWKKLLTEDV